LEVEKTEPQRELEDARENVGERELEVEELYDLQDAME